MKRISSIASLGFSIVVLGACSSSSDSSSNGSNIGGTGPVAGQSSLSSALVNSGGQQSSAGGTGGASQQPVGGATSIPQGTGSGGLAPATAGTASTGAGGSSGQATGGASAIANGGSLIATGGRAFGGRSSGGSTRWTGGAPPSTSTTRIATGGIGEVGGAISTGGNSPGGVTGVGGSSAPATTSSSTSSTDWLHTEGSRILHEDGSPFHGRGANIFDTRQCGCCAWQTPHPDEVIRRIDELVDVWHANFMRLALQSYASNVYNGINLAQWGDVTQDASYLNDLKNIVAHIGTKPGVYVMITVFGHPSMNDYELPTSATMPVYKKLAETFKDSPHVLYGVTNEPHGTTDEAVLTAMNNAVDALRSVEGDRHHVIAVQGTQNYARDLAYYVSHPVTAGGGVNIVYETHAYAKPSDWKVQFTDPAKTLPVIIGEFGPDGTYMTMDTAKQLMPAAEQLGIPYIGWSFSPECSPGMLQSVDNVTDCGTGMALTPSDWGKAIIAQLKNAW